MGEVTNRDGVNSPGAARLRRIEAVTGAAFAHLDLHDLLAELLARVREMLGVDTAVVLLLDPLSNDLVATAARGLEEEVRQGVRIPFGEGFAGRVAATAAPVVIDDLDRVAEIRNPLIRKRGIRSLLGVPLVTDERVVGVIHVGSTTSRRFTADEIELLQLVADRAAMAVDARRVSVDRSTATALQHSLVPARLPAIFGLDLAARYLPGEAGGVGGDWYDLFTLPSGHVGIVIGDVVGRGLAAAVVMGRLRSALRAYALDSLDPSEVLHRLDRKLQHFEPGQMTTVLYGLLDPSFDTITLSSAGHLPPVMLEPGSAATPVDLPVDPPLGVLLEAPRRTTVAKLLPGATLVLFTDGLVERRGVPLDRGLAALEAALIVGPAEQACQAVIGALVDQAALDDDIALLVAHRPDTAGRPLHLTVPAIPASLREIRSACRRWVASTGLDEEDVITVLLAVGEATANVVEHAYGVNTGSVTVELSLDGATMTALIRDQGQWREPRGANRGRGTRIMEQCSQSCSLQRTERGTEVVLSFSIPKGVRP